jgi:tripartite-type tricarboxylate transporter receptor subunit TctC
MEEVKRAPADGYTMILGHVGVLAVNPALFGKALPYDPVKDFIPVTLVATVPNVIAVNPDRAGDDARRARAQGEGGAGQAQLRLRRQRQRGPPRDGVLQAAGEGRHRPRPVQGHRADAHRPDGGQTQLTFNGVPPIIGQIKGGKLDRSRSARRSACRRCPTCRRSRRAATRLRDVAVVRHPAARRHARRPIVERLHREIVAALAKPETTKRIVEDGGVAVGNTPAEFAALIAREEKRWGEGRAQRGVKPD